MPVNIASAVRYHRILFAVNIYQVISPLAVRIKLRVDRRIIICLLYTSDAADE